MAANGVNLGLKSLDELFMTEEGRRTEAIKPMPIAELVPFANQPFKVLSDASMDELVESIRQNGVLSPIVARPHKDGGYEILSGHRRVEASRIAGLSEVPVVVKELDDDSAIILMVDSNLQREHILPSEKAFAYQMKLEAMKRKAGRPNMDNRDQIGHNYSGEKSIDELAGESPDSRNQIQRFIRLTNLIDPLLDMVDEKKIAMNAAVELSYLGSRDQAAVERVIREQDTAPSIESSKQIRKAAENGALADETILALMGAPKAEHLKVTFDETVLHKYFPKTYSKQQIEDVMIRLIEKWYRSRITEHDR